jgi:hypothetical protein
MFDFRGLSARVLARTLKRAAPSVRGAGARRGGWGVEMMVVVGSNLW